MEPSTMSMKISVCGKGGCGKSMVTTLLTRVLAEDGFTVLTIDADESNPGLYRMLGLNRAPTALVEEFRGGARIMPEFDMETITLTDIPSEYVAQENGIQLMVAGKIDFAFQGCACTLGSIVKRFLQKLSLKPDEVVILDTEAGVEHFGRGLEKNVDVVIAVVEPSFESLVVAEKIHSLAAQVGDCQVYTVVNKVSTEKEEETLKEMLRNRGLKTLGTIHYNTRLAEDSLAGRPLAEPKAKEEARSMMHRLMEEADMLRRRRQENPDPEAGLYPERDR
jgi:CO dehydrogenase maturation factor